MKGDTHSVPGPARIGCLVPLVAFLGQAQADVPSGTPADAEPGTSSYINNQIQRLPLSPGFWGILQSLEPTAVVEPFDFGGLTAAFLPLLSVEAGTWTGVAYRINGLNVTDPYQPGRAMFLPDPQSLRKIRVRHSSSTFQSLGPTVEVLTKGAGQNWHGAVSSCSTASALASSNLSETARRAGLMHSESFRWFSRNRLQFDAPLGKRAYLFVSGTGQWASQRLPLEPGDSWLSTRRLFAAAKGGVRLGAGDRIRVAFNGSRLDRWGYGFPVGFEPLVGRRAAPPFRLHPDLREEDHLDSTRVSWIRESSSSRPAQSFELRYGFATAHLDTTSPPATLPFAPSAQVRIELTDGSMRGPPPLANLGVRTRHQLDAAWRGQELSLASFQHRPTAGALWQRSRARNRLTAPADTHFTLATGRPASVLQLNTPLDSRGRTSVFGLHLADSITLNNAVAAEIGLTAEYVRGSLPPQSSPPGVHSPARQFPQGRTPVAWRTLAPRIALALSPPWSLNPELRASYGRYYYPLGVRRLDFANPNSLSGEEYRWLDTNGDLFWQPGETGALLRKFGGIHSSIDPSLRRPYIDEFAINAALRFPWSLRANLRLFRRDHSRRLAAVNVGVPFQLPGGEPSYRPVPVPDPGPDFSPGTFDDQVLTVYNQDPATFGNDRYLLTNTDLSSFSTGLVAQLAAGGNRYWWRLTFTAEKGYGTTAFGNDPWENDPGIVGSLLHDPNGLINATGRTFFDRAYLAKYQAAFRLPRWTGGLDVGVVVTYWDGLPFGRKLLVEGLAQGPFLILATPRGSPEGGHRTQFHLAFDLRLSREFELPLGKLRALADVFNLPNLAHNLREHDLSGPAFNRRLPVAIQPARFIRFGIEYRF